MATCSSSSSSWPEQEQKPEPNPSELPSPNVGRILSSFPTIVDRILTHLPMKDLNRSAQVCKLWSQSAKQVKKRRVKPSWVLCVDPGHQGQQGQQGQRSNKAQGEGRRKRARRDLSGSVGANSKLKAAIDEVVNAIACEPKMALMFTSENIGPTVDTVRPTPGYDYLIKKLPKDCTVIGMSSDGIVGTFPDCSRCVELESKPGFSSLLIPNVPGLELYHFDYTSAMLEGRVPNADDVYKFTGIPKQAQVKAVLIFHDCYSSDFVERNEQELIKVIVEALSEGQSRSIAIGGGFINNLTVDLQYVLNYGIAFCGDNVRAGSIVVPKSVKTRKAIQQHIEKLRDCQFPAEGTFAFMFACVGRGKYHYGSSEVEVEAFHMAFPTVPLFGFFGIGEIGLTSLPNDANRGNNKAKFTNPRQSGKQKVPSNNMHHSFTTVFVMISVQPHQRPPP